ncbi:XkdX family protein [Bacillus subtilis]|uniref:XkdX family protein n=1 Tax=Bacillus subtilis TaxID=1423 RepID=A0AC61YZ05_BACIU|nr:XkdX family protein [Bacillus subtilis]
MSDWYETIKDYYDDKLWTPEMIRDMIDKDFNARRISRNNRFYLSSHGAGCHRFRKLTNTQSDVFILPLRR